MLVKKITEGFVVQVFDTELGQFVSQEFIAGTQCDYEDQEGNPVESALLEVDGKELYLPYNMEQPDYIQQQDMENREAIEKTIPFLVKVNECK
jgi:hypothetical protein